MTVQIPDSVQLADAAYVWVRTPPLPERHERISEVEASGDYASRACWRRLKPPVSISGMLVTDLARLAKPRK